MRSKSKSWPKRCSTMKINCKITETSMKNWTRSVRHSIMKMKAWKTSSMKLISLWSRSTNQRNKKIKIFFNKFRNGKTDIKLLRKAKPRSLKIWDPWWKVKESPWSIDKSERWLFDSKMKELALRDKSENWDKFSTIETRTSKTINKDARSTKSSWWKHETMKMSSQTLKIKSPFWQANSIVLINYFDQGKKTYRPTRDVSMS